MYKKDSTNPLTSQNIKKAINKAEEKVKTQNKEL